MLASESDLALWTRKDRKTIRAKLIDVQHKKGPRASKLFESDVALAVLYGKVEKGDKNALTPQEAARRLTIKRTEEIDLNMEVLRGKRIPLEIVDASEDKAITNCAGILKASEGKVLTAELLQEIFAEFRNMGEALREHAKHIREEADSGE